MYLDMAHAAFAQVVTFRRQGTPGWASVQMNLGLSSVSRDHGNQEHIEEAILCCKSAMTVWTRGVYPLKWAKTQMNLGSACKTRGLVRSEEKEAAEDFRLAAACHTAALKIFTDHGCESDCQGCRLNLQNVEDAPQSRKARKASFWHHFAKADARNLEERAFMEDLEAAPATLRAQLQEAMAAPEANRSHIEALVLELQHVSAASRTCDIEPVPPAPAADQPAANATTEIAVLLKGLVGAAHHNGKQATVLRFDSSRFVLQLQDADGTKLRVRSANIEVTAVPVGLAVEVGGLVCDGQHNDKRGTVVGGPHPKTGRYEVQLEHTYGRLRPLWLKPTNLRLLEDSGEPTPEPEPGPEPGQRQRQRQSLGL